MSRARSPACSPRTTRTTCAPGPVGTVATLSCTSPSRPSCGSATRRASARHLLDSRQPKGILKLTELRRRQCPHPFDQVIPGQGDKPGAEYVAGLRKRDAYDAFVRKPFGSTDLDLHAHCADASARGGNLLNRAGI